MNRQYAVFIDRLSVWIKNILCLLCASAKIIFPYH